MSDPLEQSPADLISWVLILECSWLPTTMDQMVQELMFYDGWGIQDSSFLGNTFVYCGASNE